MEPENKKPDAAEPTEAKAAEGVNSKIGDEKISAPPLAAAAIVGYRGAGHTISERKLAQVSRRELLKLAPVLVLGAFAIPSVQEPLLKKGLAFSDWASARLFRPGHLAPTFADSELTPFEKFPINDYDVDDPGVIFENWTLTVGGAVQRPGEYKLDAESGAAASSTEYAPCMRRRVGT